MRALLTVVCVLALVVPAVRADEQAEATKVVDNAIKAMGGETKVAGCKLLSMKGKGCIKMGGQQIDLTGDLTTQGAANFRLDMEATIMGMPMKLLVVIAGNEGWAKVMDQVKPAPEEDFASIKQAFYLGRTGDLLGSLKEPGVKLSPLGEANVDSKPALGIRVVRPDRGDMELHFDKASGLLVKAASRFKGPRNQEGNFEYFFTDYKEFGGLKHYGKLVIKFENEDLIELEPAEVKALEKVDEGTFAKP